MSDLKIECPHCGKPFKLNETLAAPLIDETRRKFEREFRQKEESIEERTRSLSEEKKELEKARKETEKQREAVARQREKIEEEIDERFAAKRAEIAREETRKAKQRYDDKLSERAEEMKELREALVEKECKLAEAQKVEADARRKQREFEDKSRELDLTVEKKVAERVGPERDKAKRDAEDATRLRMLEKDKIIEDQKHKLAEAQRKLEQGSQQLQGEVQELDLEATLRAAFTQDNIEEIAKGQSGADVLQRVRDGTGKTCGSILWESKRTLRWNEAWLAKLRQDQREAKAEIAILVTQAMPDGVNSFEFLDGVWVSSPMLAVPLGMALRAGLVDTATARCAADGQQTKMAILYQYLTGPQFRQRVEALVEAFRALKEDLESEKRAMIKRWAAREKQLEIVMHATVGMYGDLKGIAGKTLPEIEGMDLTLLVDGGTLPAP